MSRQWLSLGCIAALFIGLGIWLVNRALPLNFPHAETVFDQNIYYSTFSSPPKHLDPAQSYSVDESVILQQIIDAPLEYDYYARPYVLRPNILTEMPSTRTYEQDGQMFTEYTLHFQSGIVFSKHPAFAKKTTGDYVYHPNLEARNDWRFSDFKEQDTREMQASDVLYAIKRMADPRLNSPVFALFSEYIVGLSELKTSIDESLQKGDVLDLREFTLAGVSTPDPYTLTITIRGEYRQFMYWLAMGFFAPIPWEADCFYNQATMRKNNVTMDWYPVGTGPFRLTENNPNARIILLKNPDYRETFYPDSQDSEDIRLGYTRDVGKRLPLLDGVHFVLEKESIPFWNKFLQGYYDVSFIMNEVFDQVIDYDQDGTPVLDKSLSDKGVRLSVDDTLSIFYFGFNMQDSCVGGYEEKQKKLRKAISYALDAEEYVNIFLNGRATIGCSPLPLDVFGARNDACYSAVSDTSMASRRAHAKQLLQEIGYPDGIDPNTNAPLVLFYDAYTVGSKTKTEVEWFVKQLATIGIRIVPRITQVNRFLDKVQKNKHQIFFFGWAGDYPDSENFMTILYGPNAKSKADGGNFSGYDSPAFNQLHEKMRNMENTPERLHVIHQMLDVFQEDQPWAFVIAPKAYTLRQGWMGHYKVNILGKGYLEYVSLDSKTRAMYQMQHNRASAWLFGGIVLACIGFGVYVWRYVRKKQQRKVYKVIG